MELIDRFSFHCVLIFKHVKIMRLIFFFFSLHISWISYYSETNVSYVTALTYENIINDVETKISLGQCRVAFWCFGVDSVEKRVAGEKERALVLFSCLNQNALRRGINVHEEFCPESDIIVIVSFGFGRNSVRSCIE